jgi:hypothetical protein
MLAKYELLLPVVVATFNCEFGDQLVIEYDFVGPALTLLNAATDLLGDQFVIA